MKGANGHRRSGCRQLYCCWSLLIALQQQIKLSGAALPDAEVWIETEATTAVPQSTQFSTSPLLATYGLFGATYGSVTGPLAFPPKGDELLCNEANDLVDYHGNRTYSTVRTTTASTVSSHNNNNITSTENGTSINKLNFTVPYYLDHEILLVPRGNCSFERKALSAQRLGASGILIYNNLQSRYGWNETTERVIYPKAQTDYECSNGKDTNISASLLQLDPPRYNASYHNPLLTLTTATSLCELVASASSPNNQCISQRCLVTGTSAIYNDDNTTGAFTVCCAWDISETMNVDSSLESEPLTIVSIFLTMRQGDSLLSSLNSSLSTKVSVQPRFYPKWNASLFLLCLFGTFAVTLAAWNSAHEYRYTMLKLRQLRQRRQEQQQQQQQSASQQQEHESDQVGADVGEESAPSNVERDLDLTPTELDLTPTTSTSSPDMSEIPNTEETLPSSRPEGTVAHRSSAPLDSSLDEPSPVPEEAAAAVPDLSQPSSPQYGGMFRGSPLESMEIEIWHVVAFLVVASTLLFLLFFFKFYAFVVVLYAFGCASAVALIILRPVLERLEHLACAMRNNNRNAENRDDQEERHKHTSFLHKHVIGAMLEVTWLDIISGACGYVWSAMWLYVYFTRTNPSQVAFYWITQDIFGLSLCILILSLIKLNSMRIGTILLVAVFFYDIFFVFVTPYLFGGKSIMVSVATSGGSPEGTADFCEKYPLDHKCRGGNPLPFLFTIPHVNDYRGGSSLLGLGDIVLPGILLSFAARLDEARRLLSRHTTLRLPEAPEKWYQGYFPPLVVAYLVGLLMANGAVVWMQRGQPALLYLVPACLGTLMVLGRHELRDLWKGPKHLRWADRLMRYVLRRV